MMRRFFWPVLATLLLEGWFLNLPLWLIVTAAAIAVSVRLACGVVKAHRVQEELIARFNDENPPQPSKSLAMPAGRHRGHHGQPSGPIGHLTSCISPSVPIIPSTAARAASSDVWP
jgi:hypothetical protein